MPKYYHCHNCGTIRKDTEVPCGRFQLNKHDKGRSFELEVLECVACGISVHLCDVKVEGKPNSFIGRCHKCGKVADIHPELYDCIDCLERDEVEHKHDFSNRNEN